MKIFFMRFFAFERGHFRIFCDSKFEIFRCEMLAPIPFSFNILLRLYGHFVLFRDFVKARKFFKEIAAYLYSAREWVKLAICTIQIPAVVSPKKKISAQFGTNKKQD